MSATPGPSGGDAVGSVPGSSGRRATRRGGTAALMLTALLALALGALTRVPYRVAEAGDAGVLRLSWRLRVDPREHCRSPTDEELASRPEHMRLAEICERSIPPHRLTLEVDGAPVLDRLVRAAGARSDRPLYVLEDVRLEPGSYRIAVAFGSEAGAAERAAIPPSPPARADDDASLDPAPAPPALALERTVTIRPGEIVVVTTDGDGRLVAPGG